MDEEFDLDEVKKKFDDVQNHLPYLGDLWKANREIFMLLIKEGERLKGICLENKQAAQEFHDGREWFKKEIAELQETNKNLMRNIGR